MEFFRYRKTFLNFGKHTKRGKQANRNKFKFKKLKRIPTL